MDLFSDLEHKMKTALSLIQLIRESRTRANKVTYKAVERKLEYKLFVGTDLEDILKIIASEGRFVTAWKGDTIITVKPISEIASIITEEQ